MKSLLMLSIVTIFLSTGVHASYSFSAPTPQRHTGKRTNSPLLVCSYSKGKNVYVQLRKGVIYKNNEATSDTQMNFRKQRDGSWLVAETTSEGDTAYLACAASNY